MLELEAKEKEIRLKEINVSQLSTSLSAVKATNSSMLRQIKEGEQLIERLQQENRALIS